jgi:penicillin-binding protein 2
MFPRALRFFSLLSLALPAFAQVPATSVVPASPANATFPANQADRTDRADDAGMSPSAPAPATAAAPAEPSFTPTWETQRFARTYTLGIPAPRGLITDRNGNPLAQTRLSQNLAINFPTPPNFTDAQALQFVHRQIADADSILQRPVRISDELILRFYHNRGVLPMDIAQDLLPEEIARFKKQKNPALTLRPVYQRFYPNGSLAAHIIGYAGRTARQADGPIQNNDLLWPDSEGREGLEATFNAQLAGRPGQMNFAFDATGKKATEKVVVQPLPGATVVTTLDENIQRLCEKALQEGAKRGAIVVMDPNSGEILAMASWPSYNLNAFVPSVSPETFKALNEDPNIPLLPRAFRSAYPPGSTFKVIVGLAALQSKAITPKDEFSGPASMQIGNMTFRNWKKTDAGMLTLHGAIEQSCDTWFYQVGIKTGADPIVEMAAKCGLGMRTGIPLRAEAEGRVPTSDYMKKTYGRKFLNGDLANLSIGQGDLLVTPLQMARAMGAVGNGGTLYQAQLVKLVQTVDNQVLTAYSSRIKDQMDADPALLEEMRKAMIDAVTGGYGTAHKAAVENVKVAGKTGTAQWGPKNNERCAAWFAGFVPAEKPIYSFAAIYEGDPKKSAHGGEYAAPMIGKVMRELFKDQASPKSKKKKKGKEPEPTPTPQPEEEAD